MAGGIGSRFWPMSTPETPKQFLDIMGVGRTMIQQTFDRYQGIIDMEHVWVVTAARYRDIVAEQLPGIRPEHILLEPCMRNTAPCLAYAAWKMVVEDPEALMMVAASDHLVTDVPAFQSAVRLGFDFVAQDARILTLGMTPTRPETGYGYIESGAMAQDAICSVASFREKPDLQTAESYLRRGTYTWNSGMFLWAASTLIAELRQYAPDLSQAMDTLTPVFFTADEQSAVDRVYPTLTKISIDYAVMEHTSIAYVLPAEFGWSDVGTWGSLHTLIPHDADENALVGNHVTLIDAHRNMVRMPDGKRVIIQGVDDLIITEHNGTLLICRLADEQHIKEWHD